jgi:hypothetical protein
MGQVEIDWLEDVVPKPLTLGEIFDGWARQHGVDVDAVPRPDMKPRRKSPKRKPPPKPPVFVYYARRSDGAIKIGMSMNINARMASLRTVAPVELLASHDGGREAERKMHKRFAAHRLDGEWFSPAPELLDHIAGLTKDVVDDVGGLLVGGLEEV